MLGRCTRCRVGEAKLDRGLTFEEINGAPGAV